MEKFEELFAQYNCCQNDEEVKAATAEIIKAHFDENNNVEVWKQCLHQIDLTTLNGDDTTAKVAGMAQKVNGFGKHFPGIPNVAAMCVYPALVETAADTLTEPIGLAAVAAGLISLSQSESSSKANIKWFLTKLAKSKRLFVMHTSKLFSRQVRSRLRRIFTKPLSLLWLRGLTSSRPLRGRLLSMPPRRLRM